MAVGDVEMHASDVRQIRLAVGPRPDLEIRRGQPRVLGQQEAHKRSGFCELVHRGAMHHHERPLPFRYLKQPEAGTCRQFAKVSAIDTNARHGSLQVMFCKGRACATHSAAIGSGRARRRCSMMASRPPGWRHSARASALKVRRGSKWKYIRSRSTEGDRYPVIPYLSLRYS